MYIEIYSHKKSDGQIRSEIEKGRAIRRYVYRLFNVNKKKWRPEGRFPNQSKMANYARSRYIYISRGYIDYIYRLFHVNKKKWRPKGHFPNQPKMANHAQLGYLLVNGQILKTKLTSLYIYWRWNLNFAEPP